MFPSPAPLAFTPSKVSSEKSRCLNCDAEMTLDHQCKVLNSDSNWEDVESDDNMYPTIDWTVKIGQTSLLTVSTDFMRQTLEPTICDWNPTCVISSWWEVALIRAIFSINHSVLSLVLRYCTTLKLNYTISEEEKMSDKQVEWNKENCKSRINAQRGSDEECMKKAFLSTFSI